MIAVSQWQPVILESELPGGKLPETRLRDWLPGRCGLLPLACFSKQVKAAGALQTVAQRGCKTADRQSALAKAAFACECLQAKVHHGAASAVTRAGQEYTNDAVQGWLALGPHSNFAAIYGISAASLDIRLLFSYTGSVSPSIPSSPKFFELRLSFPEAARRIHKGDEDSVRLQP